MRRRHLVRSRSSTRMVNLSQQLTVRAFHSLHCASHKLLPDSDNGVPTLRLQKTIEAERNEWISDEELLLASPIVYGFSLSDKIWCEYAIFKATALQVSYWQSITHS